MVSVPPMPIDGSSGDAAMPIDIDGGSRDAAMLIDSGSGDAAVPYDRGSVDADIPIDGGSVDESYPLTDVLGAAAMPVPVGQDMLMRQTHVSPDADASVPMPVFSTLAELARYRAQLPIARAMEDAAIQIAVNDRIAGAEVEAQRLDKQLSDPPGYRGEASVSHPQDRPYFFGDAQGRVTL